MPGPGYSRNVRSNNYLPSVEKNQVKEHIAHNRLDRHKLMGPNVIIILVGRDF